MKIRRPAVRSRGFSLIEVLIAVVIFSFGLLALASLQGALFKASSESKAQSVALSLAAEKLEYFRGYQSIADYYAMTSGTDTTAVGNFTYTRTWTVTRYASPEAGGTFVSIALTGATPAGYTSNNEFKRVLVNVTWTDAEGVTQRVSLEEAIAAIDPNDSAKIAKVSSGTTPRGPEVRIYDPSAQQEGVIPIAIGGDDSCSGGACAAATNPKPLVNGTNVIETRFDVTTYSGSDGSTAQALSRIETSLLGCTCDYGNADSTVHGKRPSYWNGYRYTLPEDATYTAPAGAASVSGQSDLCTICCRDHHDPSSLAADEPKFDPRNAASHALGHFLLNGSTGVLSAQKTSGTYTEACRVIRVGGLFRVAPDMYDDYMNTLDTNSLVSTPDTGKSLYVPTAAATDHYQDFVKAYLDARDVAPSSGLNDRPASVASLESANSINTQTSVDLHAADTKWLHLRGLYIDYLEDAALQAITDAKTNCPGTSGAAPTSAQLQVCVLKVLPFTTINLTELGNWTPARAGDAGLTQIVVAGNNYTFPGTLTSIPPIRGKVTPGSAPTNGTKTNAVATLRRSNSGLTTLIGGIDTEDALTTTPSTWSATQPFTYRGTSTGTGGTFTVNLSGYTYSAANISKQYISVVPSATCTAAAAGNPWSCTSSTLGVGQTLTVGNYNYTTSLTSGSLVLTCTDASTGTTFSHTFAANGQGVQTINICKNFSVSTSGSYTLGSVSPSDGAMLESTPVTFPIVNTGDVLAIGMTAQADTRSYTCTLPAGGDSSKDKDYVVAAKTCP